MRVTTGLATITLLAALAACSGRDEVKLPEGPAAAIAPEPGRPAVYAAASESPEAFVRAVYAMYVTPPPSATEGADPVAPPPGQDPIYSRKMNATIGADFRAAKGEVPDINFDPLCACQDQDAFTLDSVAVAKTDVNHASAAVAFTNMGQQTRQTLTLVREGINWKVEDVVDSDGKSLQQTTIDSIVARGG